MNSEKGINISIGDENISFSLNKDIFKNVPFHKYEKNFTFIVNGKRYETNRIVADILSPIIRNYHYEDESSNEFIINTKTNNNQKLDSGTDYFQDFLDLVYLNEDEIDTSHQKYYMQIFMLLGNKNFIQFDQKDSEKLTIDNCVKFLKTISLINESQDNDGDNIYNQVIEFVANNFDEISKEELKTLSTNTIDDILRNESLMLAQEDNLLEFLLDLYRENSENARLFEHVLFSCISKELLTEFLDTFSIEDIDSDIWRSIIYSFKADKRGNKKNSYKCLMFGLDGSGKTTILYKLKIGEVVTTIPTIGFNNEKITHNDFNLDIYDVGGQDRIRMLWHHYFENADAIMFVVDSCNFNRLDEARNELHTLLTEEQLKGLPLLIFANKCDKQNSLTAQELYVKLGLAGIKDRKWLIQKTSVLSGEGLDEGLDFIVKQFSSKT